MRWRWAFLGASLFVACSDYGSDDAKPAPAPAAGDAGTTDAGVVAATRHAKQVELGAEFGCALYDDGTLWCWGDNTYGQLGVAPTSDALRPQQVMLPPDGGEIVAIAAGGASVCAAKKDESVWCWGDNSHGELGRPPGEGTQLCAGGAMCQPKPAQVQGVAASRGLTLGGGTACAISGTGTLACWGNNDTVQCGVNNGQLTMTRTAIALPDVTTVRIGYHSGSVCAIDGKKQLFCWGANKRGQLGHDPKDAAGHDAMLKSDPSVIVNPAPSPITIDQKAVTDFVDVCTGEANCAVRAGGTVWCWGHNDGNFLTLLGPDEDVHANPVQIKGITDARRIVQGNAACALLGSGAVSCWGPAATIALGSKAYLPGACTNPSNSPSDCFNPAVVAAPAFSAIDMDHYAVAGIALDGGAIYSWGSNNRNQLAHDGGGVLPVEGLP